MSLPTTLRAIAETSKSGSSCTADIGGVVTTIEVARDLSVTAGDGLLVTRAGNTWYAFARTGTAAPPPVEFKPPPPPPPKPPQSGRLIVPAIETRSYRDGKWRTDTDNVYQGEYGGNGNHQGCAFYGSALKSLAGATVTKATIRVNRPDSGGTNAAQPTTLWLVTQSKRPAGAPSRTSSTAGPSLRRGQLNRAFAIPNSWAQSMVAGTAGGLCVYESDGSPYVILSGRGDMSSAWTLTVYWER